MVDGVMIRMNDKTSLSTIALLSTLWEQEQRDYLDILAQFVIQCLPNEINQWVESPKIVEKMRSEFGFDDIPRHVISKVLRRLSKRSSCFPQYIQRENREYYVVRKHKSEEFNRSRKETNNDIADVLNALIEYLQNNYLYQTVDEDKATEYLFHFFGIYGLAVMHDSRKLLGISSKSNRYDYYIAQFVLENERQQTPVFDKLLKITEGFLIHKAVYFYSAEIKTDFDSRLENVIFYLDCSIVLDALGYDSEEDEAAFREMADLIRKSGGRICVLRHIVDEAGRVIEAYARNRQYRNSFSLIGLDKKKYPSEVYMAMSKPESIESALLEKGIGVVDDPPYEAIHVTDTESVYKGILSEKAIEAQFRKFAESDTSSLKGDRVWSDVQSLSAIARIRRDGHPISIENCHAIIVTQSRLMNACMHAVYPSRFKQEVDFAIRDVDLVSLLWMRRNNRESQIPKRILIANAVASSRISSEIMEKVIDLATRMEEDGQMPREAALIIRSQSAMRDLIMEEVENEEDNVTGDALDRAVAKYVSKASKEERELEVKEAIRENNEALRTEFDQERLRMRNQMEQRDAENQKSIAEYSAEVSVLQERMKQKDEESQRHIREYDRKLTQTENRLARKEAEENNRSAEMLEDAHNTALRKSRMAEKIVNVFMTVMWVAMTATAALCWFLGGFNMDNWIAMVLSFLSLLQIFDYTGKIANARKKISGIVRDKVYEAVRERELERIEKIAHVKLRS